MCQIDHEVFRIVRAQIRVLQPVPAVTPFQDATMGPFTTFGLAVLTLQDEDGYIGEAPVFSTYQNILETCFLPILFHNQASGYKELYTSLYWSIRNEGFRGPAAAMLGQVDMALHDLAARRKSQPLYRYLGADRNEVKVYGSGGGVNYSLQQLEQEIMLFQEMGIDCVKIKVAGGFGRQMEEDVKRVKFVRSLIGDKTRLAVDANQVWSKDQALQFIRQVADLNIAWFEEPVHAASYVEIEELCKLSPVKIAYGESERTSKAFPSLVNAGVSHLQPVPTQLGGVREWMEVKALAMKQGVDFSAGGYSLYTSSLMTTAPENWQVEYLYSIMHGLEDYFIVRPQWKNGKFIIPDIEGQPIRIDWHHLKLKNKIVLDRVWTKDEVKPYYPLVNM